jgi:catechol 2,3-dioxygenase-like lactoylglutathione lyase family enzyme
MTGEPMAATPDLSVVAMRPFVPARDFDVSRQFYADLGFALRPLGADLAEAALGQHSFLLQLFYQEQFAANFMMHMLVTSVDDWWSKVTGLGLGAKYGSHGVKEPSPPRDEPWGLTVLYVGDPSGVLWHIAQTSNRQPR